jgi:hypothetical protein
LVGASFIVLQTKIRRVTAAALELRKTKMKEHNIDLDQLSNGGRIHGLCGPYNGTQASRVQLVWDVGNYYNYRDEWLSRFYRYQTRRQTLGYSLGKRQSGRIGSNLIRSHAEESAL